MSTISNAIELRGVTFQSKDILSVINQHPNIKFAALRPMSEQQRLIAYIVLKTGGTVSISELRTFCNGKLQPLLVPDYFFILKEFPLNSDGSIDKRKLPFMTNPTEQGFTPPRDSTDIMLLGIFQNLLQKTLGIDNDFFSEGGHSLLAVDLLARIEEKTTVRLPLSDMLTKSTVRALADALVSNFSSTREGEIIELQKGDGGTPFFLLHGDYTGGGFFSRRIAKNANLDGPFYIVQPYGLCRTEELILPDSIEGMANAHLEAIQARQAHGPYRLAGYCNAAFIALEIAQKLRKLGEHVEFLGLIDPPIPTKVPSKGFKASSLEEYRARLKSIGVDSPPTGEDEFRRWLLSHYSKLSANYVASAYPEHLTLMFFTDQQQEAWLNLAPDHDVHHLNVQARGHAENIQYSAGEIGKRLHRILGGPLA
jgi:acyl carrier protein